MTHANALPEKILAVVRGLEEGQPLTAKSLLHLGHRAAVDQALARLTRQGALLRVARGVYVRPVESRFGRRPPAVEKVVEGLAETFGEVVTPHGAAEANSLGLTTQVPVRPVYLTSGRSRQLTLGRQTIELRHAEPRELVAPKTAAGSAVRALAWLGRDQAPKAAKLLRRLPETEQARLGRLRNSMPTWMARSVSQALQHA